MGQAAVRSKGVVLLLLIYSLMCFPLFVGVLRLYLFCYALLWEFHVCICFVMHYFMSILFLQSS